MAKCTRVESGIMPDGKTRYVQYEYDDGSMVFRVGGSRSWRNNSPGNVNSGSGQVGKDYGGRAVFPDLSQGAEARRSLFVQGGKYYGYDSVRQVLKGKFNEKGQQIPDTGYAPKFNSKGKVENDPDAYANFVRQYFQKYYKTKYNRDVDIENIKMRDYSPEMLDVLEKAQKAYEGFAEGKVYRLDPTGRLVGYPPDGSSHNSATVSPTHGRQASTQAAGHLRPDLPERPNFGAVDSPMWGQNPSPAGYPTSPLPFDSPLYRRRNAFLEPMRLDDPFLAGSMGQPGLTLNPLLEPWPGSYLPGRENLLYPEIEQLLDRYFSGYPSTSGAWPPDRSRER